MKKLLKKLRDWLIRKLGGFTPQEVAEAADDWSDRMCAAEDHSARLELERDMQVKKNQALQEKIRRLNMELDQNLPPKMRIVETLLPRTLEAAWTYGSYPGAADDMDKVAKDHVTRQILDEVRKMIHYSFEHDFFGNSRIRATLQVWSVQGAGDD